MRLSTFGWTSLLAALLVGFAPGSVVRADDSGSTKAESIAVASQKAPDFTGEWEIHLGSQTGDSYGQLTLAKDGDHWKGVFTDLSGRKSDVTGEFDGTNLVMTGNYAPEGGTAKSQIVTLKPQGDLLTTSIPDPEGKMHEVFLVRAKTAKAPDPVGEWILSIQANGRVMTPTVIIKKDGDHYSGEYKRGQSAGVPLKTVTFEDGEIKFSVEFAPRNGGEKRTVEFSGKIDGDAIQGQRTTANGNATFAGKRKIAATLEGSWDFVVKANQDYPAIVTIRKAGDVYEGDYRFASGTSAPMKEIILKDGALQFSVTIPMSPDPLKVDFKGDLQGDSIKGSATSSYGPATFAATRKATAVDLSGAWAMEIKGPNRTFAPTLTLKQSGEEITGTLEGPQGPTTLQEGAFKNGELRFVIAFSGDGGEMKLTVTGKLDGEKLVGQVTSPRGSIPWTAERKKS